MENEKSWEYYFDFDECATTGNFYLYRNPHDLGTDGRRYRRYVTTPQPPDSTETPITMTHPVAVGITAYFAGNFGGKPNLYLCLSRNAKFNSISFYETYFHHASKWFFLENTKSPKPKPEEEITFIFLTKHIVQEEAHLLESEDYYLECFDQEDLSIKSQLKEYSNGYFTWLKEKRQHLIEMYPELIVLIITNNSGSHQQSKPQSITPYKELDDARFIKSTEFFLKYTALLIDNQFEPESKYIKKYGSFYPFEKGTVLSFYLKIDTDILDFVLYERRIIEMLLNGIRKENLTSVLSETYSLASHISKLSDDNIGLDATNGFFIEFDHVDLKCKILSPETTNEGFHHYFNFDFVRYSIGIKNILENKLGMKESINSIGSINYNMNHKEYLEISISEATSYIVKIEAFMDSVKYAFELQLNRNMDYVLADKLGIDEVLNTRFEYVYCPTDNFLDFELFKKQVAKYLNKFESLEVPKAFLTQIFETTRDLEKLYSNRMQYTTWDKTVTLYVKYVNGSISLNKGDSIYPEDFICKSNNEVAVNALKMHNYLKSKLFPDDLKNTNPQKQDDSKNQSKSNKELIFDYLNFIEDVEGYLSFIENKLLLMPTPLDPEWQIKCGIRADFINDYLVKSSPPAIVASTFVSKTREIKHTEILPSKELLPILENIDNKLNIILNGCPSSLSYEQSIIYFILSWKRNKVGNNLKPDDCNLDYDTFVSDIELKEFCQEISHFLKTEVFSTPPIAANPLDLNIVPSSHLELPKTDSDKLIEKTKNETLIDIWIGTPEDYKLVIDALTKVNVSISVIAPVNNNDDKLLWQSPAKYGRDQYLRGFLFTCIENGLIKNQTAPNFAKILSCTFNIECKAYAFKSIPGNSPVDKYLIPFKSFPSKKR